MLTVHPLALPGEDLARSFFDAAQPLAFTAFQLMWLACVVGRYRHAPAAERRQLRWLVGAVGTSVAVLVAGLAVEASPRAGLLTVWLIPLAAGLAIVEAAYEALVDEVRNAARRIVAAEDEARRRIEQDLHDGAQHRLVVLGMTLGSLVERAERSGDPALAATAVAARDALLEAAAELRALARGIHPSVLTKDGLPAALDALAERSPLPVRVVVDRPRPCPPAVETTAYFVVSEALTNAARHSGASGVEVVLVADPAVMRVEVSDDGCGGAVAGGGLRGLGDRVRSLGGSLEIDSPPAAGTRVRVELPC